MKFVSLQIREELEILSANCLTCAEASGLRPKLYVEMQM